MAVSRNGCRSVYTHHTGRKCKGKSYIQGHCRTTRRNCSKDHPVCTNSCHRHKSEAVSAVAMEVAMEEVEKVVEKEGGVTEEGVKAEALAAVREEVRVVAVTEVVAKAEAERAAERAVAERVEEARVVVRAVGKGVVAKGAAVMAVARAAEARAAEVKVEDMEAVRVAKEVGEVVKGALDIHHKILGNEPMPLRCAKSILGHGLQTSHSRIGGFRGTSQARSDMAAERAVEAASAVFHKSQGSECSAPKRCSHIWCSLGRLPQTSGSHTPDFHSRTNWGHQQREVVARVVRGVVGMAEEVLEALVVVVARAVEEPEAAMKVVLAVHEEAVAPQVATVGEVQATSDLAAWCKHW